MPTISKEIDEARSSCGELVVVDQVGEVAHMRDLAPDRTERPPIGGARWFILDAAMVKAPSWMALGRVPQALTHHKFISALRQGA